MKLTKLILAIWVSIWLLFLVRGFAKGELKDFKALAFKNIEEKREYILGKELSLFLDSLLKDMPEESTYKITGDLQEHDRVRLAYYLYPRMRCENPDYEIKIQKSSNKYILRRLP